MIHLRHTWEAALPCSGLAVHAKAALNSHRQIHSLQCIQASRNNLSCLPRWQAQFVFRQPAVLGTLIGQKLIAARWCWSACVPRAKWGTVSTERVKGAPLSAELELRL